MAETEVRKRIEAARLTMNNTTNADAVPYIVAALDAVAEALEKLETGNQQKAGK